MANPEGFDEGSPVYAAFTSREPLPLVERVKISDGGRLVIPAAMRAAMKVEVGDTVTLVVDGGELHVITPQAALARLRKVSAKFKNEDVSVVNELIAERRAEAQRDLDEAFAVDSKISKNRRA